MTPRPDMIEAARKFMLTPKVIETPFEEQKQFLLGKGVTEEEIAEARKSIPEEELRSKIGQTRNGGAPQIVQYQQGPQQNRVVSFAQSAVIIGSISYAGYRFMRSFVLPKFFDIPDPATEELRQLQTQVNDLQNSIKFIMDSVSQTTQQLAQQQAEITKALYSVSNRDADLTRVENGISTIKSLLLSQHNFAPIVTPQNLAPKNLVAPIIPTWQQLAQPTNSGMTMTTDTNTVVAPSDGYTTPPANFSTEIGGSLKEELEMVADNE